MDKNYRIHTNIATDTVLNVNMQQDYDFLEVLTMKLRQKDAYRLHSSNYGVIIGRVLANDAFGIPNAKISVFIERDTNDLVDIENIYPYSEVTSKDKEGRRYNLLPDYSDDDCYRIVGTFPNKRLLLDNDIQIEIYEKYWKYTTVTNNAGDYMIFGVPSGSQQIHVDIDLSDIGILSQKPRDFEYKGYNITMFDNPNQFKESTNLDSLAQLFSQDKSVFVYPFWGDADNGIAAITRCDVQIQYKFEPTCVFMGSIVSDNEGNSIGHKCAPDVNNGMNDQLVAGEGTIEMIRKTQDGLVEEYQIQGNQLIDSDGVWCYQIPMNLDFIGTDEYGNIVPTDNPNKGIPTRTQVRFRISKHDTGDEGFSTHTAKYLVPMNPIFSEKEEIDSPEGENGVLDGIQPVIESRGQEIENMYNFGSNTPQSCFRDLYWNNVYSVKNYIPKTQVAYRAYAKNYSALKGANLAGNKNPIPFNSLRIDLPFMYVIVCILNDIITFVVSFINNFIICMFLNGVVIWAINTIIRVWNNTAGAILPSLDIDYLDDVTCIELGEGLSDSEFFAPGCHCDGGLDGLKDREENYGKHENTDDEALKDLVVERLAEDFKIIKLDLYQDWINGCLYMPLWYWRKRKKKTFLFGLFKRNAKNQFCDCKEHYSQLKTFVTCNVVYHGNSLEIDDYDGQLFPEASDWHRKKADRVYYLNGLIKGVENKDGLTAYYYVAVQATDKNQNPRLQMYERTDPFYAFRLYATDIILLGNLNEENLYGIPQLFKVLPSTTSNVPPIATIQELNDTTQKEAEKDENSGNEIYTEEDSGNTVTTGMNWRHNGNVEDVEPPYARGLFMELACTEAKTKSKSCFNVERLSELGVNDDMTYKMAYANGGNDIKYGEIKTDGLISKLELDDMENRAMFATMNHIGFVPQPYQDSISGYTTQVEDENTNYLIPKFRYIYPVDFDGRMRLLMKEYADAAPGFTQHMFDELDQSYLTFRFGADANPSEGEYNRMRHFYHHNANLNRFEMPVYNNSFFFYFGINKGSTAIDKFNKMFYSACVKNDKKPFSFEIESRGLVHCPDLYQDGQPTNGYIHFASDDIQVPYSYELYDEFDDVIASSGDVNSTDITILGEDTAEGKLTNGTYLLSITDANGKTVSEEITIQESTISFEYETRTLGTEFYDTETTSIGFICNKDNRFYGLLKVTKFYIDSYEFSITSATLVKITDTSSPDYGNYRIEAEGKAVTEKGKAVFGENAVVKVVFGLSVETTDDNITTQDCMCEPSKGSEDVLGENTPIRVINGGFELAVYRPFSYKMTMTLRCANGMLDEDTTVSEIITVNNGDEFDSKLNNMPIRFMIGTTTDERDGRIANSSNFYRVRGETDVKGGGLIGWYGVHDEKTYQFNRYPTTFDNRRIWSNYVKFEDITSLLDRRNVVKYKFDRIFELSNTAYMTATSNVDYKYKSTGGLPQTLTRMIAPDYKDKEEYFRTWRYSDRSTISNKDRHPNIIGSNFRWPTDEPNEYEYPTTSPAFNGEFYEVGVGDRDCHCYIGNYFAAFTNNGRYLPDSIEAGDCSNPCQQIPSYAAVNLTNEWKELGVDKTFKYNYVGYPLEIAFTSGNNIKDGVCRDLKTLPYFRTMYVDRALDYDLMVWIPPVTAIKLHTDESHDIPVMTSRISGATYNGIEMAFENDTTYNIISEDLDAKYWYDEKEFATKDEAVTSAMTDNPRDEIEESENEYLERINSYIVEEIHEYKTNGHLEYSYSATSSTTKDSTTVWNKISSTVPIIWKNENKPSGDWQYLKTYRTAELNKVDIRNYFWSTFNKQKLKTYIDSLGQNQNTIYTNSSYVYTHTADTTNYNGEFVVSQNETNYPTKRLIDIGNIQGNGNKISLSIESCSYNIQTYLDGNVIRSKMRGGDKLELTIKPEESILFVKPNDMESDDHYKSFGHMRLYYYGCEDADGYGLFDFNNHSGDGSYGKSRLCYLNFQYTPRTDTSGFKIYPRCPRLIKVLAEDNFNEKTTSAIKTDSITYINTASKELFYTNNNDNVEYRIEQANFLLFDGSNGGVYCTKKDINIWNYQFTSGNYRIPLNGTADGVSFTDDVSFGAYIDFTNGSDLDPGASSLCTDSLGRFHEAVKVACILSSMDYYYETDKNHLRHARTIEFSEMIDARQVRMKLLDEDSWMSNRTTTKVVLKMKCDNGKTNPLEFLNQVYTKNGGRYTVFLRNGSYIYDTIAPEVVAETDSEGKLKFLTFTINDISCISEYSDEDQWEINLDLKKPSGLTYKLIAILLWDNNKWKLRTYW